MPKAATPTTQAVPANPSPNLRSMPLALNTTRFPTFLASIALTLAAISAIGNIAAFYNPNFPFKTLITQTFSLGREANIPTMFSCLLLLLTALLLWYIASGKRIVQDTYWRMWTALCGIFLYLGIDEVAQIHERSVAGLRRLFGANPYLHYSWVVPYAVLVGVVALVCIPLLRHLPSRTRNGMLLAGFIYVMGAMGLELFEGALEAAGKYDSIQMIVLVQIEETMEMLGIVLMITTLLNYVRDHMPDYSLNLSLKR